MVHSPATARVDSFTEVDSVEKSSPRRGISLRRGIPEEDLTRDFFFKPPIIKEFMPLGSVIFKALMELSENLGEPSELKPVKLVLVKVTVKFTAS